MKPGEQTGFVPDAGDLVWLQFDPQAGHEQAGHRPALVLSPATYNAKTGLMICCPLTTRMKGYPFEVRLSGERASAVLSDQVRSLDWRARNAGRMGRVTDEELRQVRAKLRVLIGS
ncbi:MAG: endoribonuclease MazF [Acetobacteraceae bacterium]